MAIDDALAVQNKASQTQIEQRDEQALRQAEDAAQEVRALLDAESVEVQQTESTGDSNDVELQDPAFWHDVVGGVGLQPEVDDNNTTEASGTEKVDAAVSSANSQQDQGERWQQFADRSEGASENAVPSSLESQIAAKAEAAAKDSATQNAGDLLNRMKISQGKIGA